MSDFLVARPSYLAGAARTLDLGGQFDGYNVSRTTELADARAIYNDWRAVGEAISAAFQTLQAEPSEK